MNYDKTISEKVTDAVSKRGSQLAKGIEGAVDTAHDAAQGALSSVSEKIDTLQNQAKPSIERMVARSEELAGNVLAATRESGLRAKQAVSRYAGVCETYVTEQPMKAVAIAAAAGATVAALVLLSRSRANKHERFSAR